MIPSFYIQPCMMKFKKSAIESYNYDFKQVQNNEIKQNILNISVTWLDRREKSYGNQYYTY